MHDVQVSSIKVTFNSGVRNVLTNLKSNTIEERILLVEELSLNYFVSRIPDHPKWPREMIAIEIPKGKNISSYSSCSSTTLPTTLLTTFLTTFPTTLIRNFHRSMHGRWFNIHR